MKMKNAEELAEGEPQSPEGKKWETPKIDEGEKKPEITTPHPMSLRSKLNEEEMPKVNAASSIWIPSSNVWESEKCKG